MPWRALPDACQFCPTSSLVAPCSHIITLHVIITISVRSHVVWIRCDPIAPLENSRPKARRVVQRIGTLLIYPPPPQCPPSPLACACLHDHLQDIPYSNELRGAAAYGAHIASQNIPRPRPCYTSALEPCIGQASATRHAPHPATLVLKSLACN